MAARAGLFCRLIAALLLCCALPAPAEPPEFLVDHWGTADGLPVNAVNRLLVGQSGYLWLATFDGLVRFDGHRFTTFSVSSHPQLGNNRVLNLVQTRDGLLWLHVDPAALVSFDGKTFRRYGPADGLSRAPIWTIQLDDHGDLWVLNEGSGMARRGGKHRFEAWSDDPALGRINFVLPAADGSYWVAATKGLHLMDHGRLVRTWAAADGLVPQISGLALDDAGRLWMATRGGVSVRQADGRIETMHSGHRTFHIEVEDQLVAADAGRFEYIRQPDGSASTRMRQQGFIAIGQERLLLEDAKGGLWHNRIDRLEYNGQTVLTPACKINDITLDRSGALWVATACDGIYRLRERHIHATTQIEGKPLGPVYGTAEDHDGRLWLATLNHGVAVIDKDGSGHWMEGLRMPVNLHTVFVAPDGSVRIGRCHAEPDGVCAQADDLPARIGPVNRIGGFLAASDGSVWLGGGALWHKLRHGTWQRDTSLPRPAASGPAGFIRALAETRGGTLWLGTRGNGLLRRGKDGAWRHFGLEDGLSSLSIRALRQDRDGNLWVATENRGLCRIRQPDTAARIACLGREQGLGSDSLHQVFFDDHGRLWLNSNDGIIAISRAKVEAVFDGTASRVHPQLFTEMDGLPDREGNGGVQDAGIRLADGRMVFPTQEGIALLDPDELVPRDDPPRARIEKVAWPGQDPIAAPAALTMPLGTRMLTLYYTGLSNRLTAPVYFRYRLGPDRPWIEVGNQRQIHFDQLAPGDYPLEIQALGSAGEPGKSAHLPLHVPPYLWETSAFRLALLLALALAIAAILWRQRRQARRRQRLLEATVSQRTVELRKALAEIEHLAASQSRFFANVSHELRTPITLLTGPLEDLAQGRPPSAELADAMARNAARLERLIGQLLDLERLEANRFPLRPENLDLNALVRDTATAFTPLAQSEGIHLDIRLPGAAVLVRGDSEQLVRVVGNLLSNALKFCPAQGEVRLTLECTTDGGAVLAVEDSGPGIPPDWRERVFDRFSQMRSAATRSREGTGLGLALCREVAVLHGGSLVATDSALGGARLVFQLPAPADSPLQAADAAPQEMPPRPPQAGHVAAALANRQEAAARASAPAEANPAADDHPPDPSDDRPRVLVAEDHPDLRRYLAELLAEDYRVASAEDGAEALQMALDEAPDLIVTDLMMPRLDGLGLARAVREHVELAGVPVIFLTARASDADRIRGLAGGADYYLTKPFDRGVLLAQLAAARRACERLRGLAIEAADETPADAAPQSPFVQRLRAAIEEAYADPACGVATLAQHMHMSPATLRRHCQAELAASPGDLLRRHRLEQARHLLRRNAGNVSEIAYAVGYNRLASFSRAYREHFGHPPGTETTP